MDDIPDGIKAIIAQVAMPNSEVEPSTVHGHYGFKKKELTDKIDKIFIDIHSSDSFTDVLDTHFKEFNAEQRVRVFAFAQAALRMRVAIKAWDEFNVD